MSNHDDQPVEPAVEEPVAPPPAAPKPKKAKAKAKAPIEAVPVKAKAPKAKPKAAKAVKKAVKAAPKVKAKRQRNEANLDEYGYRKGSIRSKAAHIYARKKGATLAEVKEMVGSVQFNLLNEVKKRGHKVREQDEQASNGRKRTRYFLSTAAA